MAEGALRGIAGRPLVLKRYVDGADQPAFYQKRAPESRPPWLETVTLRFPSGRSAEEIVVRDAAQLIWVVNLGCIDLHPHPVRADDLDHPDELRVDLDPVPVFLPVDDVGLDADHGAVHGGEDVRAGGGPDVEPARRRARAATELVVAQSAPTVSEQAVEDAGEEALVRLAPDRLQRERVLVGSVVAQRGDLAL